MLIGEVYGNSHYKLTKSISSSGKVLFIDLKKQYYFEYEDGTKTILEVLASIKYKKMNSDCQTWIDLENNVLMTPVDLNTYNNSFICNWLINMHFGSYITLKFIYLDVIFNLIFI